MSKKWYTLHAPYPLSCSLAGRGVIGERGGGGSVNSWLGSTDWPCPVREWRLLSHSRRAGKGAVRYSHTPTFRTHLSLVWLACSCMLPLWLPRLCAVVVGARCDLCVSSESSGGETCWFCEVLCNNESNVEHELISFAWNYRKGIERHLVANRTKMNTLRRTKAMNIYQIL